MIKKEDVAKKVDFFKKKIKKKILIISALKHIGLKNVKKNLLNHVH